MAEMIKFHNLELPITEILPRRETQLVPLSWTYVMFKVTKTIDVDKIILKIEDWLRKNTHKKYYIDIGFECDIENTSVFNNVYGTIIMYFEDQNDAFYTKLIGLEAILDGKY